MAKMTRSNLAEIAPSVRVLVAALYCCIIETQDNDGCINKLRRGRCVIYIYGEKVLLRERSEFSCNIMGQDREGKDAS